MCVSVLVAQLCPTLCNPMDCRRRQWHPTPVLLPGKSHGWRSQVGCSLWGRWGSDTTEWLHFHFSLSCIGEGNGNPLQCSCLENPRDGGAWWAAVYGVAQSRTRLKWLSSSSSSRLLCPWSSPGKDIGGLPFPSSQISILKTWQMRWLLELWKALTYSWESRRPHACSLCTYSGKIWESPKPSGLADFEALLKQTAELSPAWVLKACANMHTKPFGKEWEIY